LVYYFFGGKKVTKKANAKKGVFAYFASFHCAKSAKPSFAAPKLRFFIKISICITRFARSFGCSDIRWFLASHGGNLAFA